MDPNVLHLAVAVGLTLVLVVVTALIWSKAQVKTVFWWIGLTLLPLGLYLLGLAPALVGAYETLWAWWTSLSFTPVIWVGLVLAGLSALLMLGSRLIPSESRADRRAARQARSAAAVAPAGRPASTGRPMTAGDGRGAATAPQVTKGNPPASRRPAGQGTPSDVSDDEITQILKRRGIE